MANNPEHISNEGQYYATTSTNRPSNDQEYHFPPNYTFQYNNNGWYYNDIPTPPVSLTTRVNEPSSVVQTGDFSKSKRSQKQRLRDVEDEDDSHTPLVDALPPPPHDPDERSSVLVLRPCSMAAAEIPLNLRCAALIKADYPYRMCESCRTRFKLAELRSRGVRYEGKLLAKELPGEHRKGRGRGKKAFRKPRPQLIEYNGELVLDPAYMASYQLDPKVFGAQASTASAAAQEEAEFTKALKAVTSSLKQKSVEANNADNNADERPVDKSVNEDGQSTNDLNEGLVPDTSTSSTVTAPPASIAVPSSSSSTNLPSKSSGNPLDGLMRVRICSVKNCHNPIPVDYFWKMCESCRILYRAWGVSKRDRKREKRLEALPPEERERREAIRLNNKARLEAKLKKQDASAESLQVEFDPYVAPRPCTFATCKNHVPGNSSYKRCDYHRAQGRESHVKQVVKKEAQKAVWKKAVEEGNDPEEALMALLQEQGDESNDESVDSAQVEGSEKTKSKNKIVMETIAARRNRENIHLCSVKECQNLLQPDATWRICELCRMADQISKRQKVAEARRSTSVVETSKTKNVTPALPQEATKDEANLFQVQTPATYTPGSTTTTTYPALFTWSAAPSFVQHNNIPISTSTLSASRKIFLDYSNSSSSTLSMALQPTPSIAQHQAQRTSQTSTPQVTNAILNQQQSEVPEQTDAFVEMDQNLDSADYNFENLQPQEDQTDSFEITESLEDSPNTIPTLYGKPNGTDSANNSNGLLETGGVGANVAAPKSSLQNNLTISATSLPQSEISVDDALTVLAPNTSTTGKTATQSSPRSKKACPSKAASSSKKAKQQAAAPPVPYMYPYPPFGAMPPYMPVPMTNPDGTPVPMPPYPYYPPFMMPPYTAQTQGQVDGKSTSLPAGPYPYPYPYPVPPPLAGIMNGSNGSGSAQTTMQFSSPFPVTYTMPDGSQATFPSFPGYPYPYQPYPGAYPSYPQQQSPPVPAETVEKEDPVSSALPKSRKKSSVPGSSVFSINSKLSRVDRGHTANVLVEAGGSSIDEMVALTSQNQLLGGGVGVTQNVNATADAARAMDLSKVAAAEQYVRALMSRPTTPTGEVTPLSLSILPADRMPAPDNTTSSKAAYSNDHGNSHASTSLKRKAVLGDNGEASGDDMLQHRPKTKLCSSDKCNAALPISSSQKYCRDCRTKIKLKKKVMEMKKRLKLVGRSRRNLTGGLSTSKQGADDADTEILLDDVDAEGDADDEVNIDSQI